MLNDDVIEKWRDRYPHIHPLIFQRSKERAANEVELFDILEEFPDEYPVVWDEQEKKWVTTEDITLRKNFRAKKMFE